MIATNPAQHCDCSKERLHCVIAFKCEAVQEPGADLPEHVVFGCKLAEHVRPSGAKCSPEDSRIICDGFQRRDRSDGGRDIGFGSHGSHHSLKHLGDPKKPDTPLFRRCGNRFLKPFFGAQIGTSTSNWNIDNAASLKVIANSLKVAIMTACRRVAFIFWNACAV